jgi:hypothetical protein
MKIRRHLCATIPSVLSKHFNPIFNNFMVGYSHTSDVHSGFCMLGSTNNVKPEEKNNMEQNKQKI